MRRLWAWTLAVGAAAGLAAQEPPDALAAYRRGDYQAALAICEQEIAGGAGNMDSYVVICWSLIALGRVEEAREYALTGYGLSRYDPRIVEALGEVSYHQGKNAEALRYFQDYINLAPGGARVDAVYYYIGEINIRLGRFQYADIALSTAIHYQPDNALWLSRLGYAKERSGRYTEAVRAYEAALARNAALGDARRGLERAREALRAP